MASADSDRRFIESRTQRRKFGLMMLPAALVFLGALWALFFIIFPLLVNPWTVFGRIATFEPATLHLYAIVCAVLANVIFALLIGFVIVAMVWAKHERRYLKLLAAARQSPAPAQKPEGLQGDVPTMEKV